MENVAVTTEQVLTIEEAMARVKAAGWGGLSLWSFFNTRKQAEKFMACLIGPDGEPDYRAKLWDWQDSAGDALLKIVERAEREGPQE